jgi:dTDP-4-amino-4,6-dideoxygalactose transaminase
MTKKKIAVGHFETTDRIRELVNGVLDSGRISYGPLCKLLESDFADIHETEYGVVSASGTDSLRAALHAAKIKFGWGYGDEVIVPATTFVATINVVTQLGLIPVFADIEPEFYCLDPIDMHEVITPATVAVIPVNLLGQSANLWSIQDIAIDHDLVVIEDSCEAMFVHHMGRPVGSNSFVGAYSFYMAHLITAGVGGIAITDDTDMYQLMRSLLNHGRKPVYISIDDDDGLSGEALENMIAQRFAFLHPGYSSRMTELQAAIALPQLMEWEDMLARRQAVASRLTAGLSKYSWSGHLQLPAEREKGEHAYMMYGIKMRYDPKWPLVKHLEGRGIETRDILPLVNQPMYNTYLRKKYPVSEDLIRTGFYIGSHLDISEIRIGTILYGYCNGWLDDDYWGEKVIEAIGPDWVIARNEKGEPLFASFHGWYYGCMREHLEKWSQPCNAFGGCDET